MDLSSSGQMSAWVRTPLVLNYFWRIFPYCNHRKFTKQNLHRYGIYMVHSISFQIYFVEGFNIDVDSWKFSLLLLYILWDDWLIIMISDSNEQLQQQLEYTLLKPDCHSWGISKMQSGREDTLEERYAIQLCFKLAKMP